MLSREGESQEQAFSQVLGSEVWEQGSGLEENLSNQGSVASGDLALLASSQVLQVCSQEVPSPGASSQVLHPQPLLRLLRKLVLVLVAWVELVFLEASGSPQVLWCPQEGCSLGSARQRSPPKYQVLASLEPSRAVACSLAQVSASLA